MRDSGVIRQMWAGLRILIVLTVITGIVYPLAVWGVSRVPGLDSHAEGSVVTYQGHVVGSSLIGVNPIDPNAKHDPTNDRYFHTRPSATADDASSVDRTKLGIGSNDPSFSLASNESQVSQVLQAQIAARRQIVATREGVRPSQVPADAVTESGSGVDPDISPDYAQLQVARVARVNNLPVAVVRKIVRDDTSGRAIGVLGEPVVNVLACNIAVARAVAARTG
ncbi:MAG TPA: potassium-transporting ATPase subunit C [Pseudonocardiaceae bacterium]|jgi:K+-transporting ATPase ATPase C chain|nr:potassium-transporting ATPase subunit C [Pseudonocardiaceae bacterium]